MKEVKESLQLHSLSLSFTFIKTRNFAIPNGFSELSKSVDFLHVHRNFTESFIKAGVPKSKIVLAIEFMGRGNFGYYTACDLLSKNDGWEKIYDSKIGAAIKRKTEIGRIKIIVVASSRSVANDVRYAVRSNLAGVMAYTIDSDDSQEKCGIDTDTFNDFGSTEGVTLPIPNRKNNTFPLLRTINEAVTLAVEEMKQEGNLRSLR